MAKIETARKLHFGHLDDLLQEARRIAEGPNARSRGSWTPAQNIWHVGRVIQASVEGFPGPVPFVFKLIGPLIKGRFLKRSFNPGIKLPPGLVDHFTPPPETTPQQAIELIESVVAKQKEQGFIPASPLFGKLSAQQWIDLHCRHAEMHFGLIELTD